MMATYAAMIDRIDQSMGTLVAGLKERGVLDNTLILFLSDNGGNAEGGPAGVTEGEGPIGGPQSRVLLGMNWATLNNTPFARYKHFTHEGGIGTPLIAHWPAGIAGRAADGKFEKQPGHLIDVMATASIWPARRIRESARATAILPMEGVSLRAGVCAAKLARPQAADLLGARRQQGGPRRQMEARPAPQAALAALRHGSRPHRAARPDQRAARRSPKKMEAAWTAWAERTFVDPWPGPDHTDWGADIRP